ncbi:MAG TPA: Bcr/CflA family multidrug efflux MFS transporter [Burkholderiales bacterium]|nr:Bcr/CflA family multidrug efflux MFS transporter [Burkholderiales bacterium]
MDSRHRELIVVLGVLTAFAPMSIDMYLPALPTLAQAFHAGAIEVQLTLATFFVGFALGQAFYGPVTDRFGRKPPLYAALALFIAASVGCALAPSIQALAAWRFAQALGACAGIVIARAIVRDRFEPHQAVRVYAALMLVMGIAPILAPLFGGHILVSFGWRAIFWVIAGFGVICLALALFRLPETHSGEAPHPFELGHILAGYGRLLAHRRYLGYALTGGFSSAGMFAYIAGSPFVLIDLYRIPPQHYGWIFGSNAFGLILASQLNGRFLHHRFGGDAVLYGANLAQTLAGIALLAAVLTGAGGLAGMLVPLFIYIACIGLVMPNATALAMAPHGRNAGAASSLLGALQFALAAVTAIAIGAIHDQTALPMAAVIAICGVLGLVFHRTLVGPPEN